MVAQAAGPSRPPASIEDFLFNLHSTLAAAPSPLAVEGVRDAYSQHLGHKCAIERWLVVGDGGLAGTFKRIPHIVTMFQANGVACCKPTQAPASSKEQLIEADQSFRRELQKKNQAAKAKAGAAPAAPAAAKAPSAASKAPAPTAPAPTAKATAPESDVPKQAGGPTRPPATIEDFLWNLHRALEASESPMPIDNLKDAYSQHLGHKCNIERFLVVGDIGLAGTLKRIPHVVTVTNNNGVVTLTPTLQRGSTREQLIQADKDYRKALSQKNVAAKAAQAAGKAPPVAQPPAAAAKSAPVAAAPVTRTSEGGGEPDAKKQKTGTDAETLSRMLVQGVVRVLQARAKEGKGPLLVSDLAEEFKLLWKVPFNLQSAGYTDVFTFLKAWTNKVELTSDASGEVNDQFVVLAKKGKAEPEAKAPPLASGAATEVAPTAAPSPPVKAPPPAAPAPAAPAAAAAAAAAAPAAAVAPTDSTDAAEPDAKKAKTTDMETLSRMLVQGVVRVLQSRAKEGKGELLVSNLADEFKALWKVPFNLQSAGYTDVNTFLKAWPNKVEFSSFPNGDVVSLAKKSGDKAKADAGTAAPQAPAATKSAPAKPSAPALPPAAAIAVPASATSPDLDAPIPTEAVEIRKELAKNVRELEDVARRQQASLDRQKALLEALSRIS